ncbi:MAG TPA: chromate transporter [Gemmataceae bacterium]|nr:chromate transporter [Gemmataceae bacterium]
MIAETEDKVASRLLGIASSEMATRPGPAVAKPPAGLSCRDLLVVFFRAGMSFGGGPGIVAALEHELVRRRQVVSREDYLTAYAMARMVPSGTTLALAIAFGYRFQSWRGTVLALAALLLPAATITVIITAACLLLAHGPLLTLLSATLLPAALAFIVASTLKLGQEVFRPSMDLLLAATAAALVLGTSWHPSLILLGGGLLGLLRLRGRHGGSP